MTEAEVQARKAAKSKPLEILARIGLSCRGLLYLLIGFLALQIAFGSGGEEADSSGAVQIVAEKPGGTVVLWLLVVGLAGLALWRLAEAAFGVAGPEGHKASKRLLALGRGIFYIGFCVSTLLFTIGARKKESSDEKSHDITARVMQDLPAGRWLVLLAGLVLIGIGAGMAWRAVSKKKFMEKLTVPQQYRRVVEILGMVGRSSRALVFAGAGVFLAYAGLTFDPDKAKGIDGTLRELAQAPFGPWLLTLVALGLAIFGVYSFCEARWRRVTPG